MIPTTTLNKISDLNILDILSKELKLKRNGSSWVGLCPIHNEKTPSFNVIPSKNIYKCFGCGAGGDIISFYMTRDRMSFPQAVRYICENNDIPFDEKEDKEFVAKKILYEINKKALEYMISKMPNSKSYKEAINRGISDEMIAKFQICHATPLIADTTKHLLKLGYKEQDIRKAGICKGFKDEIKDYFQNRLMFPIHDINGKIIGFSGRRNIETVKAKYINSPTTPIYDKSKELFGLYFAKKDIINNDNAYVVEGAADVVSMHQAGILNTVGTLGTSLTALHALSIKRFTNNITIIYDGDMAGLKAIFKACEVLFKEGLNVFVVKLENGYDPDSYIKEFGADKMVKFISDNRKNFIDFKYSLLDGSVSNKIAIAKEIKRIIELHPDDIAKQIMLKEYQAKFGIKIEIPTIKKVKSKEEELSLSFHLLRVMLTNWQEYDFYNAFKEDRHLISLYGFNNIRERSLFDYITSEGDISISQILHNDNIEISDTAKNILNTKHNTYFSSEKDIYISKYQVEKVVIDKIIKEIRDSSVTQENRNKIRLLTNRIREINTELNELINN